MARIARVVRPSATDRTQFLGIGDHKPMGNDSNLEEAMQLLGVPPAGRDGAKRKIVAEVNSFLKVLNSNSPRIAEDLERLGKAERLARSLDATLSSLSFWSFHKLGQFLPKASFHDGISAGDDWFMVEYVSSVVRAAKAAKLDILDVFGKDKGGKNVTVNTLTLGNPYTWLMRNLIQLYAEANGAGTVTSTTTRKTGGCYNFIDAVHRYATGEAVGHSKEYKRLVRQWKERREIATKKGA
jgi:hypothetical protein